MTEIMRDTLRWVEDLDGRLHVMRDEVAQRLAFLDAVQDQGLSRALDAVVEAIDTGAVPAGASAEEFAKVHGLR
ncbi:MAG: hypothetical protein ACRDZQ_12975 [Acidimicrobiales bacterium]